MNIENQIKAFISGLPNPKQKELKDLHQRILEVSPNCKLWFDTGVNKDDKTVSNPTIGYGYQLLSYAKGNSREFFQIGLSPNLSGFSIYIIGIKDKLFLNQNFGNRIGKASISGYCIKFKKPEDLHKETFEKLIKYGFERGEPVK